MQMRLDTKFIVKEAFGKKTRHVGSFYRWRTAAYLQAYKDRGAGQDCG